MAAVSGLELLGAAGAVFAMVGILGTAMAILFARFRETNKDILRKDIQDLNGRLATVESAEQNCQQRLAKAEATIKTLTDVVTGATAVAELREVVDQNHNSVMLKLDQLGAR